MYKILGAKGHTGETVITIRGEAKDGITNNDDYVRDAATLARILTTQLPSGTVDRLVDLLRVAR